MKKIFLTGRHAAVLAVVALSACLSLDAGETVSGGFGREVKLRGAEARIFPCLYDKGWGTCPLKGRWAPEKDGSYAFSIEDGAGGTVVDARATQRLDAGKAVLAWDFSVRRDFDSSTFAVCIAFPSRRYAGGSILLGTKTLAIPVSFEGKVWLGSATCRAIRVCDAGGGEVFSASLPEDASVMAQDDRKWGGGFTIRVHAGDAKLRAGERRRVEMAVSAPGGVESLDTGGFTISKTAEWIPLSDTTDILPGSALDFSKLGWTDAPAGKHGRVVARGPHFEFEEKPGVPQRFYGCNLCFSANYLPEADSEELCSRLERLGYNALRIHHYESELCEKSDGTALVPEKMAELDGLLNACIRHGIYLTTDLFVSRRVPWRACGIDRDGVIPMGEFKELVLFDERVFGNYLAFARNLLCHVNPATGRRWADEPALAFLALVNEGNPGNKGYAFMAGQERLQAKWRAWLAERRAESPDQYRDITEKFPASQWEKSRQNCAVALFLADLETAFANRMTKFIREEIGSKVLLTDLSCWQNPVAYQLPRTRYDYVDDHFYVDHPHFLEKSWQLPSQCPNANPVRRPDMGFQSVARHRLLDRPFTITEFNFSGPGQYRGVGGMMLGAQAALQEYDGIWRFAWSHSRGSVLSPRPMGYFDVASDPLQRMTERAVLTLYLRRDIRPLARTFAAVLPEDRLRADFDGAQSEFGEMWFGWYSKLGTWVGSGKPAFATDFAEFPKSHSLKADDFRALADGRKPGDGQVAISRDEGVFAVDTPRTQGFFAEEGRHAAGALSAAVSGAPAAVWASSLDGADIPRSGRILLTHVTDVQDEGTMYADRDKKVLLKWGRLPHMMRAGRAGIRLRLAPGARPKVYALRADGSRRGEIAAEWNDGTLAFVADTARDPSDATCLYEISRE